MGRGSGTPTFRAATSRGGGLTPARRGKTAGNEIIVTQGPYAGQRARIQNLTRNGARATVNMGEGRNTVLLSKSELNSATYPRRGR